MCNAWNHPPGCTCGWGGDGHLGRRGPGESTYQIDNTIKHYCFQYSSFVNPNAKCPVCGEPVYYYESPYGGKVYFDSLGPPWPKHPCIDYVTTGHRQQKISYKEWNNDLWQPFQITKIETFDKKYLKVTGFLLSQLKEIVIYIESKDNEDGKLQKNLSHVKFGQNDNVTISTFEIIRKENSINIKEIQITGNLNQPSIKKSIEKTIKKFEKSNSSILADAFKKALK